MIEASQRGENNGSVIPGEFTGSVIPGENTGSVIPGEFTGSVIPACWHRVRGGDVGRAVLVYEMRQPYLDDPGTL